MASRKDFLKQLTVGAAMMSSPVLLNSCKSQPQDPDPDSDPDTDPNPDLDPDPIPIPDPEQGLRADWMRGSYGLNWKPIDNANGKSEDLFVYIGAFLEQIQGLTKVDYIQLHLNGSFINSPVHLGHHNLLESLWQGDTDDNGNPINLVVPRRSAGRDPFLAMLKAVKAAGLKTQVYVNCSNMLLAHRRTWRMDPPEEIADITERWKQWCDTNEEAQAFIDSQPYHTDENYPERQYLFCYAEFVLKEYAIKYGDLIDAWIFDSAKMMYKYNGDDRSSGRLEDQRIYQAWAEACNAGNPDAARSFNNSQGSSVAGENPWGPATLFDDYIFGHPFAAGNDLGEHSDNKRLLTWSNERNGYVHTNDPDETRTWDDMVIGHFDPPMSTTSWNGGKEPALTNEEFVDWYVPFLENGGAISFGVPLQSKRKRDQLLAKDYAMEQLELLDQEL